MVLGLCAGCAAEATERTSTSQPLELVSPFTYTYNNGFGRSTALDGDNLVVGAKSSVFSSGGNQDGLVVAYRRSGMTWVQDAEILDPVCRAVREAVRELGGFQLQLDQLLQRSIAELLGEGGKGGRCGIVEESGVVSAHSRHRHNTGSVSSARDAPGVTCDTVSLA